MKSKIFLDIDQDNNPIIKIINFDNSDDIKDKLLKIFLQNNRPQKIKKSNSIVNFEVEDISSEIHDDNENFRIIDEEVLAIKFTGFSKDQQSIEKWQEYTIKPKGFTYLLTAFKIVSNKSKEYYEWEKYCDIHFEAGFEEKEQDIRIAYHIKLEEVKEYLNKGFKVSFPNEFECKLINDPNEVLFKAETKNDGTTIKANQIQDYLNNGYNISFGEYELKSKSDFYFNDLDEATQLNIFNLLNPAKKEFNKSIQHGLANIHTNILLKEGTTVIIENGITILELVLNKLKHDHKIEQHEYTTIQDNGMNTIILNRKDNEVNTIAKTSYSPSTSSSVTSTITANISMDTFIEPDRRTGRTTRLADEYIQRLFKGEKIIIKDHLDNGVAHIDLFKIIENRLKAEHDLDRNSISSKFGWGYKVFDFKKLILQLEKKF